MANWAIINRETETVENVIFTADGDTWPSTDTHLTVEFPTEGVSGSWSMLGMGWKYSNGQFVEPPVPVVDTPVGDAPNVIA